jgi:3-oxoacyl-[acyl-carrier-protein] synthase II
MVGHTGGAAAVLGVAAAALMLRNGVVPPNAPIEEQDPRCPVWLPQRDPVPLAAPSVLVNAYAFGGMNISLLVEGQVAAV